MNGTKGVGTYILNSSATGAPSETGTWVAKGTATDTRHTTTDTDYTQDFVGTFEQDFVGTFTGTFVGEAGGAVQQEVKLHNMLGQVLHAGPGTRYAGARDHERW